MTRLFRDIDGECLCPQGSVVCIGAFDGLHLGHRALVLNAVQRARALGVDAVALSFEPLPREFFASTVIPARLSLARTKFEGLRALAVDRVGLLRFDARMAAMSATDFIERVLVRRLRAREVWVGPEFRFGHGRAGDVVLLRAIGDGAVDVPSRFSAHEIAPMRVDGARVSSSAIRALLGAGELDAAARLLGRPYAIAGRVVRGAQLGRKLGYPTANLRFGRKTPALSGIFATRVHGIAAQGLPAVASFGTRPTVDGVEPLLEAHVFDFDGDLYGQRISIEFVAKLRDEARFDDLDALTAQMHRDAAAARDVLGMRHQRRGAMA